MKYETMTIAEFMSRDFAEEVRIKRINRNKTIIKVAGLTVIILGAGADFTFAASSIDEGASRIYYKIANAGKWFIICKGGISIIKSISDGDNKGAQKHFLSGLLVYLLLLAFPWGMTEVENLFKEISSS
jgi:hypothetical protein